jgi:hypothetical protein
MKILASTLRVPLWLAILVAMVGCIALVVLGALGALYSMPGAQSAVVWFWFALIAVYFSARAFCYYHGRETSLLEILGTVAALHALALSAFFWGPLVHRTGRVLVAELIDQDFRIFIAIFVSLWIFICILITLRYERLGRFDGTRAQLACAIVICGVLLLIVAGVQIVIPGFQQIYESFGADLPEPTRLLLAVHPAWHVISVTAVVMAGCIPVISRLRVTVRRRMFDGLIGLLVFTNLALIAGLSVMFLPMFPMCGPLLETGFTGPPHGFTRLHAAAILGRADSVRRLIARGEPMEARDIHGLTPLQYAVSRNRIDAARALLGHGARPDTFDPSGRVPLHSAVAALANQSDTSLELLELLLKHGAPIDAPTQFGVTALHIAVLSGRSDIATLLLARGADVNAVAMQGTPLDSAHKEKNSMLVELLVQHGAVRATEQEWAAKKGIVQTPAERPGFCG